MKIIEKLKTQGITGLLEAALIHFKGVEGSYSIYKLQQHYIKSNRNQIISIYIDGDENRDITVDSIKKSKYQYYKIVDTLPKEGYVLRLSSGMKVKPWALDILSMYEGEICYFDEDIQNRLPIFKSNYNPFLLRSYPYIGKSIYGKAKYMKDDIYSICLNYHLDHIEKVLVESPVLDLGVNEKNLSILSQYTTYPVHIKDGLFDIEYPQYDEGISVIIPNKDHVDDLDMCLKSLKKYHTMPLEIIIMENNSTDAKTFEYYQTLKDEKVVYYQGNFNYAKINNQALEHCHYSNILFLNNDIIFQDHAIDHMLSILNEKNVGIVGARLFYPDLTLQHAGIFLGIHQLPYHALSACQNGIDYLKRDNATSCFMAVTGACMMIKKDLFKQIGMFDETFQVAYNDIDLCLKVLKRNYQIVYDGTSNIIHCEYKSRGKDTTDEKKQLHQKELSRFKEKWGDFLKNGDPYYNSNLSLLRVDYLPRIRKERA